eukprot:6179576-Prymnesium_polylepis.2
MQAGGGRTGGAAGGGFCSASKDQNCTASSCSVGVGGDARSSCDIGGSEHRQLARSEQVQHARAAAERSGGMRPGW